MNVPIPDFEANSVTIRLMEPKDIPVLREAYLTNVPEFLPADMDVFDLNVREISANYFVIEENGCVVAGGGINLGYDGSRCWLYMGFVHRSHHRKGLGTLLTLARLGWTDGEVSEVFLITHKQALPFYQRFGFKPHNDPQFSNCHEGFELYRLKITKKEREEINKALLQLPINNLLIENGTLLDINNLHIVTVIGPRPDFRVFISLLYGDPREVDTDGDSEQVYSRDWSCLWLKDQESGDPFVEIFAEIGSNSFEVRSESLRLAEMTAYYLYEYCGSAIQAKGKTYSEEEIATLSWEYQTELARARESIWHQSSEKRPCP